MIVYMPTLMDFSDGNYFLCNLYPIATKVATEYRNDKHNCYLAGNQYAIRPQSTTRLGQNSHSMNLVDHQHTFSISFSGAFKTPKQLPFSQDGGSMPNVLHPNTLLAELVNHTRSSSLSGTLGPECALSLLSSSHPSPITGQAHQATSSLACQDATTPSTVAYSSGVAHHAFVADALFDDPSQVLPFIWQ